MEVLMREPIDENTGKLRDHSNMLKTKSLMSNQLINEMQINLNIPSTSIQDGIGHLVESEQIVIKH